MAGQAGRKGVGWREAEVCSVKKIGLTEGIGRLTPEWKVLATAKAASRLQRRCRMRVLSAVFSDFCLQVLFPLNFSIL